MVEKLKKSFHWILIIAILLASALLMLGSSRGDSVIIGEWLPVEYRPLPIILTLFLTFFIYIWSKELIGRWWALLPAFLFAFSPTVLAYGHYATADIILSLGIFLAIVSFLNFLTRPSLKNAFAVLICIFYLILSNRLGLFDLSRVGLKFHLPAIFLMKESPSSLALIVLAISIGLWGVLKSVFLTITKKSQILFEYLKTDFQEFAMIVFVILYLIYLSFTKNTEARDFLPIIPFIYILTASIIKRSSSYPILRVSIFTDNRFNLSIKALILTGLTTGYFFSSVFAYPNYISYFNAAFGGAENGYRNAIGANYDLGQDLKRLSAWVAKQNIEKIAIDYYGKDDPRSLLSNKAINWSPAQGNPKEENIEWLAISITNLRTKEYRWLNNPYQPYTRAGTSIFIYKLGNPSQ